MKKLLIAVAAVALAGCAAKADESTLPKGIAIGTMGHSTLYMFQDNEQGNICYAAARGGSYYLSCVPREQQR